MKQENQEEVTSRDLYELAYYLTKNACKVTSIEVTEELGKPACLVTLSGQNLKKHQLDYLNGEAPVDAISYRKSLSYIRSLVYGEMSKAKKREAKQ